MRRRPPIPIREERRTLAVADPARYRLAVMSDTHSRPHPATVERLAALGPDAILHAGDIGDPYLLDRLGSVAPVLAVRGNVDDRGQGLPDALLVTLEGPDGPLVSLYVTHVGVYGPRLRREVRERASTAGADLVVCGHSHVPLMARDGRLVVFNPGSCGPRRFGLPITLGFVELSPRGVDLGHVDCETGERWTPPPGPGRPTR